MTEFIEFAIFGFGLAAGYALSALGVVLIYRGSGVVNFAQGGLALIGAYVYYETSHSFHSLPAWVAAICGVAAAAAAGLVIETLIMWPMRRSSFLIRVVATLGVLTVIEQAATIKYGTTPSFVKAVVPTSQLRIGKSFSFSQEEVWLFGIALVLTAVLWWVYRRTRIGLATSAVSENEILAASLGWSPRGVATFNWGLGGALAGLAGVLLVPHTALSPTAFDAAIVATLSAALFGAFKSFPLTFAGALVIGVLQSEVTHYVTTPGWTDAVPVLVIIAVLMFRGTSLPARSFIAERLPSVGTGRIRPVPVLLALVAAAASSWIFGNVWTVSLIAAATFAIVALSVVVTTGYAGQVSLAQFAFAGMGALFAGRLAAAWHFPFLLALPIGIVLTVPIGVLFALPAIRTRGVNLAVVTLGLALVVATLVLGNPRYTGGVVTGTVVANPTIFGWKIQSAQHPQRYAIVCLVLLALAAFFIARIRRRGAGRRLLAVRDNERAAASIGINVVGAKVYAFGIGAATAALGGIMMAFQNANIDYTQFGAMQSVYAMLPAMIGGIGYIVGGLIAGAVIAGGLTQEILSHFFSLSDWWLLILGVVLVLQLIAVPDGAASVVAGQVRALTRLVLPKRRDLGDPLSDTIDGDRVQSRVEPKVLEMRDVVVRYGATRVLDGLSLEIRPGEVLGLIGPNGAGKTTLIDLATGFAKNSGGQVLLGGVDIRQRTPQQRARMGLTRSWQSDELFEVMTVEENLRTAGDSGGFATYFKGVLWPEKRALQPAIAASVRRFELTHYLSSRPADLPYADRRLVGIARAVATEPSVLLLDEPAAGLDSVSTQELVTHIRALAKERGVGILLIEHDVEMVMRTCDRVVAIDFGRVIASGSPEEVRAHPAVIAAYLGRSSQSDSGSAGQGLTISQSPTD